MVPDLVGISQDASRIVPLRSVENKLLSFAM